MTFNQQEAAKSVSKPGNIASDIAWDVYGLLSSTQLISQGGVELIRFGVSLQPQALVSKGSLLLDSFSSERADTKDYLLPNVVSHRPATLNVGHQRTYSKKSFSKFQIEASRFNAQASSLGSSEQQPAIKKTATQKAVNQTPSSEQGENLQAVKQQVKSLRSELSTLNSVKTTTQKAKKAGIQASRFNAEYGFVELDDALLFGGATNQKTTLAAQKADIVLDHLVDTVRAFKVPRLPPIPGLPTANLLNHHSEPVKQAVLSVTALQIDERLDERHRQNSAPYNHHPRGEAASPQSMQTSENRRQETVLTIEVLAQRIEQLTKVVDELSQKILD